MSRPVTRKCGSPQLPSLRSAGRTRSALKKIKQGRKSITSSKNDMENNRQTKGRILVKTSKAIPTKKLVDTSQMIKNVGQRKKKSSLDSTTVKAEEQKSTVKNRKRTLRKITNNKRNESSTKQRIVNKSISNLRQMSLRESFSNQALPKRLRPRRSIKNYCDDSELIKSCTENNAIVVVKNLDTDIKSKVPVYKSAKNIEESVKNANEVYDFKYDVNDTVEKLAKRKKKRVVRKILTKGVKKKVTKQKPKEKVEVNQISATSKSAGTLKEDAPQSGVSNKPVSTIQPAPCKNGPQHTMQLDNGASMLQVLPDKGLVNPDTMPLLSDQSPLKHNKNVEKVKPTILSVENLSNKRVTVMSSPLTSNPTEFRPFRPTNIFSRPVAQHKDIHNVSLLNKSLSPILKATQNFDPGSPWRPPSLSTFSQVKNLFQSTPLSNKFDVSQGRIMRVTKNDTKLQENISRVNDIQNNNPNQHIQKHVDFGRQKKKSVVMRKFGTEITNIDHSIDSDNPVRDVNEKILVESESTGNVPLAPEVITFTAQDSSMFDDMEDKENTIANHQTPKKAIKHKKKKTHSHSPHKSSITVQSDQKENIDPKPEPLSIRVPGSPDKVLQQSNLNNFLNLTEMPESTRIVTSHGIFDDTCPAFSKSSTTKLQNKAPIEFTEIKNAFGFSDEDSNENIPRDDERLVTKRKKEKVQNVYPKKFDLTTFAPARISIGAIRNKLLAEKREPGIKSKQTTEKQNAEGIKPSDAKKNQVLIDVSHFSDTFDMLSETGEAPTTNVNSIPLFADLEPIHFTQPPRYSYKRKRDANFSFYEESSDEDKEVEKCKAKRQKHGKLNKQDTKRLQEWVKNVNQTFEEIDQFDLVIE